MLTTSAGIASCRATLPEAYVRLQLDARVHADVIPVLGAQVVIALQSRAGRTAIRPVVAHGVRHPMLDLRRDRSWRPTRAVVARARPDEGDHFPAAPPARVGRVVVRRARRQGWSGSAPPWPRRVAGSRPLHRRVRPRPSCIPDSETVEGRLVPRSTSTAARVRPPHPARPTGS